MGRKMAWIALPNGRRGLQSKIIKKGGTIGNDQPPPPPPPKLQPTGRIGAQGAMSRFFSLQRLCLERRDR